MVTKGREFAATPVVPGLDGRSLIKQPPGLYTLYTFAQRGKIWAASVSYGMATTANTGNFPGYAQVVIQGGITLAIVECAISSSSSLTPSQDSNTDPATYNGLIVPAGTVIQLDVNNGVSMSGVQQRASCRLQVSIP